MRKIGSKAEHFHCVQVLKIQIHSCIQMNIQNDRKTSIILLAVAVCSPGTPLSPEFPGGPGGPEGPYRSHSVQGGPGAPVAPGSPLTPGPPL